MHVYSCNLKKKTKNNNKVSFKFIFTKINSLRCPLLNYFLKLAVKIFFLTYNTKTRKTGRF